MPGSGSPMTTSASSWSSITLRDIDSVLLRGAGLLDGGRHRRSGGEPDRLRWIPNGSSDITEPGNHRYRVRICVRGRDTRFDGCLDGDPVEDYLIQMWRATSVGAPRQVEHTSGR